MATKRKQSVGGDRSQHALATEMISPVKLVKLRRQKLERKRQEMRDALPKLNKNEIRRYRMPYDRAVLEELSEDGYVNSAEYLVELIEYQTLYRKEHQYEMTIMSLPVLRESDDVLNVMSAGLKAAEIAHINENSAMEIDEFLKLAIRFGLKHENRDWAWLVEQLFGQCIDISDTYIGDQGFRQAEVRYVYGKYLIECDINLERGMEILDSSRLLCLGKNWTANRIMGRDEKLMYVQVCTILYKTLVDQIHDVLICDPELAYELCMLAKKRALDACLPRADVFLLQGKCESENGMLEKATTSYMKSYLLYRSENMPDKACEAQIGLALAYMEMDLWEKTTTELEKVMKYAVSKDLPLYEGKAYLYMGQYHLNHGTPKNSTPFLNKAFNIFHELNDNVNREFVQNLGAVSRGQELITRYVDLILRCEIGADLEKRGGNVVKLCRWKDLRDAFWDEDVSEVSELSEIVVQDIASEDMLEETVSAEEFAGEEGAAYDPYSTGSLQLAPTPQESLFIKVDDDENKQIN